MFFKKRAQVLTDEKSNAPFRLIVGCLVFVLTLALTGTFSLNHFIERFNQDILENLVFEVDLVGSDAHQHQNTLMVLQQTLNGMPGVRESVVFPVSNQDGLAPASVFIEARINPNVSINVDELLMKMHQVYPNIHLQSHKFIQANIDYLLKSLKIFSYSIITLIATTIIIAISLITRSSLRMHRSVIDILRLIGAPNGYIARQFQWLAFKIGFSSSLFGVFFGVLVFYSMIQFGVSFGLPSEVSIFDQRTVASFLALPAFIALLSLFVARVEVFRTLVKLDTQ